MLENRRYTMIAVLVAALGAGVVACNDNREQSEPAEVAIESSVEPGTLAMTIGDAYMPVPIADSPGVLFFTVVSRSDIVDTLVGVTAPVATQASMHTRVARDDGTYAMTELVRVPVPARSSIRFSSGGDHIMLEGIALKPVAGDSLSFVLHFARAGDINARALVITYQELDRLTSDRDTIVRQD